MTKDIGKTAMVFGMGLGLNAPDFQNYLIKELKKVYKLKWGFKDNTGTDLFIWIWTIGEYYGSKYLIGDGMEKEAFLFQEIMKSYFSIVAPQKFQNEIYTDYNNLIVKIVNMDRDIYTRDMGLDYDERVRETMVTIFTLRILQRIKPEIKTMKPAEINTKYEVDIRRIQHYVQNIFYFTIDLISHYLKESDEFEIEKIFSVIREEPVIKKILENLKKKYGKS